MITSSGFSQGAPQEWKYGIQRGKYMPVTAKKDTNDVSQRDQYVKGGIGAKYWDMRDAAILSHIRGQDILDAGCGEGITFERVIKAFPDAIVHGLDVDPENIRICKQHGLNVTEGSLYDLPFADNSFDTSLLIEVIEHLESPDTALKELSRVTKPGGRVIVVFPVDWGMWLARMLCLRWNEARFDPGHLRQWNFRELSAALVCAGFVCLSQKSLPLPFPLQLHGLMVAVKE